MKKPYILLLFFIVVILLGVSTASVFLYKHNDGLVDKSAAVFEQTTKVKKELGELKVYRNGSETMITSDDYELIAGDRITVSDKGESVIYWPDGSLSRVKGPADITIKESLLTPTLDTQIDVQISSGEVWTKVLDLVTENSRFTLTTKHTVASIRGTEVYEKISEDSELIDTYEHGVTVTYDKEKMFLLEGEQFLLANGQKSMKTRTEQNPWVEKSKKMDTQYIASLSAERANKFSQILKADQTSSLSQKEWTALIDFSEGDVKAKNVQLLKVYRTLLLQIKNAQVSNDMETVRKKSQELTAFLEAYVPALELTEERESLLPTVMNDITLGQKMLFGESIPVELSQLRMRFGLARLTLLGDDAKASGVAMQRQLFLTQDFLKDGRKDVAEKYLKQLAEFDRINEPTWKDVTKDDQDLMQKTIETLVKDHPTMKEDVTRFKKRILTGEREMKDTPMLNTNTNTEVAPQENMQEDKQKSNRNSNAAIAPVKPHTTIENTTAPSTIIKNVNVNTAASIAPVKPPVTTNTNTATVTAPRTIVPKPPVTTTVPTTTPIAPPIRGVYTPAK